MDEPMANKTFVERVAEVIESHIEGHIEEDERERKHYVLDGFDEAAAEIEKIVEEMLPKEAKGSLDEHGVGWNDCRAELRLRLKGGV
jgi:demethoxyubiquinone hydroxylase (CLK1/Coq7/Cat5 family)